jgi:hypothetical protein
MTDPRAALAYRLVLTQTPVAPIVVMYVNAQSTDAEWRDAVRLGTRLRLRVWAESREVASVRSRQVHRDD